MCLKQETQVHHLLANNFIIAKCIIGSLHFFVCTQNIKSGSDNHSHRAVQRTSDLIVLEGIFENETKVEGACMTGGNRYDCDKNVCFYKLLISAM